MLQALQAAVGKASLDVDVSPEASASLAAEASPEADVSLDAEASKLTVNGASPLVGVPTKSATGAGSVTVT